MMNLPPVSILTNTQEIIEACELAEISGSPAPSSSSSSSSSTCPFILTTQLASLVVLRQYNHARHLWRRYSEDAVASAATGSEQQDLYQFHLLWKAIQPLLKLTFGNNDSINDSIRKKDDEFVQLQQLQLLKKVYTNLKSCMDTNQYPLSNYASELKNCIRDQIASLMEMMYDTVSIVKCELFLGTGGGGGGASDETDLESYLISRKWEKCTNNSDFWIPCSELTNNVQPNGISSRNSGSNSNSGSGKNSQQEKVDFLSNVIGFMEKKHGKDPKN